MVPEQRLGPHALLLSPGISLTGTVPNVDRHWSYQWRDHKGTDEMAPTPGAFSNTGCTPMCGGHDQIGGSKAANPGEQQMIISGLIMQRCIEYMEGFVWRSKHLHTHADG